MAKDNDTTLSAETIIKRTERMFRSPERSNAESIWTILSEFILPNQHGKFFNDTSVGDKKTVRLYDSTAVQANHDLASAIHATLTNPATQWAKFKFSDPALMQDKESREWLQRAEDTFHKALGDSNFANELAKGYKGFGALGSMCLMHEENDTLSDTGTFSGFRFKAWHLAECAWAEGANGDVAVVYRKFKMTARQSMERWGKETPMKIRECMSKDPEQEFEFIHCIFPRDSKEVKLNEVGLAPPKKRPIASVYVFKDSAEIVEEGGYYEMPVYVTRWDTMPGEVYGRGPGHIAIPDVRTLNKVKELGLHAINKAINPPMLAEQRSVLSSLDLRPGQVSVVKDINGIRELVSQARFDVTQFAVADLQNAIRSIFFLDKLFLPDRTEIGEMTAFETARRLEQLQRVLGPTLGRLNAELLDPIVKRGFNIMLRGGAFGQLPRLLRERGGGLEVEYVNTLSRTQRIEDVQAIQNWAQSAGLLAQLGIPEAIDAVNSDGAMQVLAEILGVPEEAIRGAREIQALREQRAQAQQQMQALQAANQAADVAAKVGPLAQDDSGQEG